MINAHFKYRQNWWIYAAITVILLNMTCVYAQDSLEIRSPVFSGNQLSGIPVDFDYTQFGGFYYEIDDDIGSESITIDNNLVDDPRTIYGGGLIYTTVIQQAGYEYSDWGAYPKMGFLGEEYVPVNGWPDVLSKLIVDSDDKYTLRVGQSFDLGEGYVLTPKQIDVVGNKVWLELSKDGIYLGDQVITIDPLDAGASTWDYTEDNVGGENDVVIMRVHVNEVFQGQIDSYAVIEGLWLISNEPLVIESDDTFDMLKVVIIGDDSLTLENGDDLTLTKGEDILLAGDLKIAIADSDDVRFYFYKDITAPGTYEVRGTVATGSNTWDYNSFAGFYYDLDENIASEEMDVTVNDARTITEGDLVYTTTIQLVGYEYGNWWGTYPKMGFLGEEYVPVNYMPDVLSKLILDSDDKYTLRLGQSLDLGEGYALTPKQIDAVGNKVWLELSKDGIYLDDQVITVDPSNADVSTWDYEEDNVGGENNVVIMKVHVESVFQDQDSIVVFKGLWLMSNDPLVISHDDLFVNLETDDIGLEVTTIGDDSLTLQNSADLILTKGQTLPLAGWKFRIADSDDLRYYLFEETTVDGTTVDKAPLIAAITAANAKVGSAVPGTEVGQYPQAAIDAFKAAIAAAQAVVDNSAATQADVNQAVTSLTTASAAIDAAQITTVDKAPLITAITAANAKVGEAVPGTEVGQYPQTAIDAFKAAIAATQAVVDNPVATQADVNQASANLATASAAFDAAKITTGQIIVNPISKFEGDIHDVAVAGNYAYITDWKNPAVENGNSFVIVNITLPSTPILAGSIDVFQYATGGVAVSNNYAYVADYWNGLSILDISDPSAPSLAGTYNTISSSDVAVSDDYAYVADGVNGLVILDISNPSSPTLTGTYSTANYAGGVAVSGNYAYIANQDVYGKPHGLVIVDIRNPSSPTLAGNYDTVSDVLGVAISGNYAYLANGNDGLLVVDISNPLSPTLAGSYDTAGNAQNVAVSDKYVYVADSDNGVLIVDISNPLSPILASSYDTAGNAQNVAVSDKYVYVADAENGLVILQIGTDSGTIPLTISELSGKDITTSSITLTWTSSADVARVDIYRDNVLLGNVIGSTSYVDSNLTSDTTYSYTLIPYSINGLAGEAVSISLKTKSSSSGGGGSSGGSSSKKSSSSSGGGGGAGSVEDFANVAMKDVDNEYLKINANVTCEFSREGNPIQSISFYSLKNSGEITSTIEVLNSRSKLVNSTPEGDIYKYVNIWVGKAGFATPTNIKDSRVKFKVDNSWIEQNSFDPSEVRLQRYNGVSWEILPITTESITDDFVVFEAQTPGFSPFAITAEKALAASANNEMGKTSAILENDSMNKTQPEKTPGFGFGLAVLVMGISAFEYRYLRRR